MVSPEMGENAQSESFSSSSSSEMGQDGKMHTASSRAGSKVECSNGKCVRIDCKNGQC